MKNVKQGKKLPRYVAALGTNEYVRLRKAAMAAATMRAYAQGFSDAQAMQLEQEQRDLERLGADVFKDRT